MWAERAMPMISVMLGLIAVGCTKSAPNGDTNASDVLEELQLQYAEAPQLMVQLKLHLHAGGHGQMIEQGPFEVTLAWKRPDFLYVHEGVFGDNPARWYWLEGGKLTVFEEWRTLQDGKSLVRGVRITNFADLAKEKSAFRLARQQMEHFAFPADTGFQFLDLIAHSDPRKVVMKRDGNKVVFQERLVKVTNPWVRTTLFEESEDAVYVEYELDEDGQLKVIMLYPDKDRHPNVKLAAHVTRIDFEFDQTKLTFPKDDNGIVHSVELDNESEIESDLIDRIQPVPRGNGTRVQRESGS